MAVQFGDQVSTVDAENLRAACIPACTVHAPSTTFCPAVMLCMSVCTPYTSIPPAITLLRILVTQVVVLSVDPGPEGMAQVGTRLISARDCKLTSLQG